MKAQSRFNVQIIVLISLCQVMKNLESYASPFTNESTGASFKKYTFEKCITVVYRRVQHIQHGARCWKMSDGVRSSEPVVILTCHERLADSHAAALHPQLRSKAG